jgi:catechol 2,3-dioxygenase-like lactoylglutathione lyase family enzyme
MTEPRAYDIEVSGQGGIDMRVNVTSVLVDDQAKALRFYTDVLGFVKKTEVPLGEARWLTVVSPEEPEGTELLLEPDAHPAAKPFKQALVEDGIPYTSFAVEDVRDEFERLRDLGVRFTQEPGRSGPSDDSRIRRHVRQPDPNREPAIAAA